VSLSSIYRSIATAPFARELERWLGEQDAASTNRAGSRISLKGASGSLPAFLTAHLNEVSSRPFVILADDPDAAAYLCSDIQQVLRAETEVRLFPPSDHRPYDPEHVPDPAPVIERADILQQLNDKFTGVLVLSVDALIERVPKRGELEEASFEISTGQEVDPESLIDRLVGQGFSRVEFVERPGDLALRGGILDVFPFSGAYPIRIEFFGDEIDSIREFDIHTQRSVSRRTGARIVPDLEGRDIRGDERVVLPDYFSDETVLLFQNPVRVFERITELSERVREAREHAVAREEDPPKPLERYYVDADAIRRALLSFPGIHTGPFQESDTAERIECGASPQPPFGSRIAQLRRRLTENHASGIRTTILCDSRGQEARLLELLEDDVEAGRVRLTVESIHEGFEVPDLGLAVYTDHQIFERYHRPTARRQKQRYGGISLRELQHLSPGDFVVHIDYGIGTFAGLEKIEVRGHRQEVVRLQYQGGDVLYVNVNALYKLHKYKGKEGHQPRLTKLGSGQWERTKSKTKSRVKDIARDLIKLYAQRKASDGFAFSGDTVWQQELEASFAFEDTPDQASAAEAVKEDMMQPVPMDRLVCGYV